MLAAQTEHTLGGGAGGGGVEGFCGGRGRVLLLRLGSNPCPSVIDFYLKSPLRRSSAGADLLLCGARLQPERDCDTFDAYMHMHAMQQVEYTKSKTKPLFGLYTKFTSTGKTVICLILLNPYQGLCRAGAVPSSHYWADSIKPGQFFSPSPGHIETKYLFTVKVIPSVNYE